VNSTSASISANRVPISQPDLASLQVGGLTPLTTTDYPGKLAAVVFCQGCPWRCGYCHNPHLISRACDGEGWHGVESFLLRRQGLLDAVVFSGGEPTLQSGLFEACTAVREMGFKVGLHTAGPYPERLEKLLPVLDWVGMDIKAPFSAYDRITRTPGSAARARESLSLLLDSGVEYEVRTTLHAGLLSQGEVLELAHELAGAGVRHFVMQAFRTLGCAEPLLCQGEGGNYAWDLLCAELQPLFQRFSIRRA
jgi:pyruvate formate lyase activating enzyme